METIMMLSIEIIKAIFIIFNIILHISNIYKHINIIFNI